MSNIRKIYNKKLKYYIRHLVKVQNRSQKTVYGRWKSGWKYRVSCRPVPVLREHHLNINWTLRLMAPRLCAPKKQAALHTNADNVTMFCHQFPFFAPGKNLCGKRGMTLAEKCARHYRCKCDSSPLFCRVISKVYYSKFSERMREFNIFQYCLTLVEYFMSYRRKINLYITSPSVMIAIFILIRLHYLSLCERM